MAQGWRGSYVRYKEFYLNITASYKKRPDIRAFLEIILSLSTIIFFLVFALKPTAVTIVNLLSQIKERKATLSTLTQKVSDLQTAAKIIQENQDAITNINIAVPGVPNPDIFSQQVEGLAVKSPVDILGVSISPVPLLGDLTTKGSAKNTPLPGGANEMPFSISIKGTFPGITSFVRDFDNMRITTKIDTMNINSSIDTGGLSIVAVLSGRVPFLYEKK